MQATKTRIHQKVDEAEIALVLQCKDSHEFYERYVHTFPRKKKGIDSISKIWKRRSEFVKKQLESAPPVQPDAGIPQDLGTLISAQNKHMTELSKLAREQLQVSKDILAILKLQNQKPEEPKQKRKVTGITIQTEPVKKEPQKKKIVAKPAPILIGS